MAKRLAFPDEESQAKKRAPSTEGFLAVLARKGQEKYGELLSFDVGYTTTKGLHLIVGCKVFHWHPPAGSISRLRLVVYDDESFYFQVMLHSKEIGRIENIDHFLSLCDMMANVNSEYKFCPGIDPDEYEVQYLSKIRYDIRKVRRANHPFERIDSCDCLLYHRLAKNASIVEKELECVRCSACKRLVSDLNERLKTAISSPDKIKRQKPSSNCPLKYVSM